MYLSIQVSKNVGRIIVPLAVIEFHEEELSFGDLLS